MIKIRAEALDAGHIFNSKISDHAPQLYHIIDEEQGPGPCVTVYTWNIMGRCRADQLAGRESDGKSGYLSNNGYRLNESVSQYEGRLFEQIVPIVSSWLVSEPQGVPVLVCLQEVDAHPRTQDEFLKKVEALSSVHIGHVSSSVGYEHASVSIWTRDHFQQIADPIAIGGDKGLLAIDLVSSQSQSCLRLVNAHLPFCGLPHDAGYDDGLSEARSAISHCVSTGPLGLLVVAGDFNLDVRGLNTSADQFAHACVEGTAKFEDKCLVLDGCIAAHGLGEQGSMAGEVLENSRSPDLFHGFTRSTYITHSIHYNLQGKVHSLSDDDLFALGLYHFADQPVKLEEFLSKQPAADKKRAKVEPEPELFYGKSREEFIAKCIHFNLQDQVDALTDRDLFTLGCCQFAVQPMKLEALLRVADEQYSSVQATAETGEAPFYGYTRKAFIEQFILYKLQSKVQDLSDNELFRLGQLDYGSQSLELEQLHNEAAPDWHAEISQEEPKRDDAESEPHMDCHGESGYLQESEDESGNHFDEGRSCETSSSASREMFTGHTRSSFMKQCLHFSLHGKAAPLEDIELFTLGLSHFGVQALKLEALLQTQGSQKSQGPPAPVSQYDGTNLFCGPRRIDFINEHITPELHSLVDVLDDNNLFRIGRYQFSDQVKKLEELNSVTNEGDTCMIDRVEAAAIMKPKLFYGLTREAFIDKSIRYTLKHKVDQLEDEVLFWLGRQQFSTQHEHLEGLMRHTVPGKVKAEIEPDRQKQQAAKLQPHTNATSLPSNFSDKGGNSSEKLFFGLDRVAFVAKYIHYKLQGRVARLNDDQLFVLGKSHFSDQVSTVDQILANIKSETNAEAMQRMGFQSAGKRQPSACINTAVKEDMRVGTWSYSLADRQSDYTISQAQDGNLLFSEEMSDDTMTVQNIATLVQSAGSDGWFVGQLMQTDTGKIIGMIRIRFEGCYSISNFKALEDETWETEDVIACKEAVDLMEGLNRTEFVKKRIHHKLQFKVGSLKEKELAVLASRHFNEQHLKLKDILAQRPQTPNTNACLQLMNGHDLPREEFIRKHIHNKLHGKVHDLTEDELFDLGQLQYADQFHKFMELRPNQPARSKEKKAAANSIAALTNTAATLRLIEMSRKMPFHPCARQAGKRSDNFRKDDAQIVTQSSDWSAPPEAGQAQWEDEECWDAAPAAEQAQWGKAERYDLMHAQAAAQTRSVQEECRQTLPGHDVGRKKRMDGLGPWLEGMRLSHHLSAVEAWCEEMGAVTLLEVAENVEDLVETMVRSSNLRPLEQRRLKQAAASLVNGNI